MALHIQVNLPEQSCAASSIIHYMPCKINHDGAANITGFFSPYVEIKGTGYTDKSDTVLEASFRGYPLQGKKLEIPHGFTGIVLNETKKPLTDMEQRKLGVKKSFSEITYWNWDCFPTNNDSIHQSMDWLQLSKVIHEVPTSS